jgi:FtsZ-interacting cell division protein ZipA
MIKRVIGVLFTLVVLVVILFAALEWGNYRSLAFNFGNDPVERVSKTGDSVEQEAVQEADSLDVNGAERKVAKRPKNAKKGAAKKSAAKKSAARKPAAERPVKAEPEGEQNE